MPIRPENKKRYPPNWDEISLAIRKEAGWCCEFCGVANSTNHPKTGSRVVLTVAHLDNTPENCERENLRALCQRCHLNYDREIHIANRRRSHRETIEKEGQTSLQLEKNNEQEREERK